MNVKDCPFYSVTTPQGTTTTQWLGGHTVKGFFYYVDPFQNARCHSLRTTFFYVTAYGGGR